MLLHRLTLRLCPADWNMRTMAFRMPFKPDFHWFRQLTACPNTSECTLYIRVGYTIQSQWGQMHARPHWYGIWIHDHNELDTSKAQQNHWCLKNGLNVESDNIFSNPHDIHICIADSIQCFWTISLSLSFSLCFIRLAISIIQMWMTICTCLSANQFVFILLGFFRRGNFLYCKISMRNIESQNQSHNIVSIPMGHFDRYALFCTTIYCFETYLFHIILVQIIRISWFITTHRN